MNVKRIVPILGLVLLAALVVFPGPAKGEMYVEAYVGGSFPAESGMSFNSSHFFAAGGRAAAARTERHSVDGWFNPAFIGGLKIGTWFVKEGFLGYDYPDWAKYLGFYLDFSYHRLDFGAQKIRTRATDGAFGTARTVGVGTPAAPNSNEFFSEGTAATLAFMFAARYGFFPDSDVPFGRLQPYVAAGPAILFTSQSPTVRSNLLVNQNFFGYTIKPGSESSADICLAVETGVRWMALKNVSLDLSFKYRYAAPSYSFRYYDPYTGGNQSLTLKPDYNLFSFQCGAAYHF